MLKLEKAAILYNSIYKPIKTVLTVIITVFFVFVAFAGTPRAQTEQDPTPCASDLNNLGILCAADKLNKVVGSYTAYQNAKDSTVVFAIGKSSGGSAMSAQEFNKWDLYSSLFESQGEQYYVEANVNQGLFTPVNVREAPFPWDAAEPVSLITVGLPLQAAIDRMRADSGCTGRITQVSLWKPKHDPAGEIKYYITVMLEQPGKTKIIGVGTNAPYKVYNKCV